MDMERASERERKKFWQFYALHGLLSKWNHPYREHTFAHFNAQIHDGYYEYTVAGLGEWVNEVGVNRWRSKGTAGRERRMKYGE